MVMVHDGYTDNPNLASDGVHISGSSLCLNAGNNSYYHGPSDIDGGDRIKSGIVDIGADEYGSP
jgi:hypothetical protein